MNGMQRLQSGIDSMGLDIAPDRQVLLLGYIDLLKKWNKVYNLTALRDESLMITHHLLDSLSILPYLTKMKNMLDVGSGGGQPGIPVAICRPDLQITLLDANTKKTAFLQQAVIELGLKNVRIISGRVEAVQSMKADVISSRAFAELGNFVSWTKHLLDDDGLWVAMKGIYPHEEIATLPEDVELLKVDSLMVPELNAERHIVLMRKKQAYSLLSHDK